MRRPIHGLVVLVPALLLAVSLSVRAQTPTPTATPVQPIATHAGFVLGLRADVSMVQGESHEIVYDKFFGYTEKMSELIWDLDSIPMVGLALSLDTPYRLSANLGFWTAVGEGSGALDNRDWLIYSGDANWSHWSHSPVDLEEGTRWEVNLAYALLQKPCFNLKALIGYRRLFWEWADYGGFYVYSSESGFRDDIGTFDNTTGIEYEQTFEIPYLGFTTGWRGKKMAVDAYGLFSPMVSADDEDYHVLRDIHFTESFDDGTFWALGLNARYHLTPRCYLLAGVEYQEIEEIRGSMKIDGESVPSWLGEAGISHKSTTGTLALGYEFGR